MLLKDRKYEILKAWRKRHPNYHRNWMRNKRGRGSLHREPGQMKQVFGFRIDLRYFAPLHTVSKEQAEQEFLALTNDMMPKK